MRVKTTPEEDRFVADAAKEYYQAAIAVDAFQRTVLKSLREITDEFNSKLVRLGLPFASALERKDLAPNPWIQRKITRKHLEAGISLMWFEDDPELEGKRLCVYWWIWLKDRNGREDLAKHLKKAIKKPFEWESVNGTSYINLYFSLAHSTRIKEQARKCTAEFVRTLNGCRKLVSGSASPDTATDVHLCLIEEVPTVQRDSWVFVRNL
jgi:hypothetical protein